MLFRLILIPSFCLSFSPFPPPPSSSSLLSSSDALWFNQTLDHHNIRDLRRWQQRYWTGWDFYKLGGPVFILIGGEGEENPNWLNAGALHEYAKQFNGKLIAKTFVK